MDTVSSPSNQNKLGSQDILSAFQNVLGRGPTQQEIQSFLQYANNGQVNLTPFDVQQILQGTPEYQQNLLQSQGGQLQNVLGGSDQRILGLAQGMAGQQIASTGRSLGSSGYLNAFAQQAANLAMGRQQQLASFYGQGFQNQQGLSAGQGGAAQQFGQSQQQQGNQFAQNQYWYNRQRQDYFDSLNKMNSYNQQRGLFGSIGGALGGGAGALIGNYFAPGGTGAMLGGSMGGQLGGGIGQYSAGVPRFGG